MVSSAEEEEDAAYWSNQQHAWRIDAYLCVQARLFSSGTYAAEAVDAVANHRIQQNWAVLDSEEEIERETCQNVDVINQTDAQNT